MFLFDSLQNFVSGLGTGKDKASHDTFALTPLDECQIDAMVDGDWVAKKIVELPVRDMFRVWRSWSDSAKRVTLFEQAEKRHGVRRKLAKAMTLARRYGGSAILIGDGTSDPSKPLAVESIKKGGLKYLTVLTHRQIVPGTIDRDTASPTFGEPEFYTINNAGTSAQLRVHNSRVIRFVGAERLDIGGEVSGWGYSVLQAPYDAVRNAALVNGASASMVHEAKVDVVQIENLAGKLQTPESTQALIKRWSLANMLKGLNSTLLLDKNETWNRTQTSFTGIADLLSRFLSTAAAAAGIPESKFLGRSASSGLHNSGDTDIRNYYDDLASERERVLGPVLDRLDALLWRDATGAPANKASVWEWGVLWTPTLKEQADTEKVMADTLKTYVDTGIFDELHLAEAALNGIIERGLFPGLEHISNDTTAVENDPAGNTDPAGKTPPKTGKTATRSADARRRGGFARFPVGLGGRDFHGSAAPAF